jgi:membrane-bound serine protease (ClpP class)
MTPAALRPIRRVAALAALALGAVLLLAPGPDGRAQETGSAADAVGPLVRVLEIDGAIGPATAGYVRDGLDEAAQDGAALVVLRMDTPGGLSAAMRDIISAILDSPVPVASYIAPSGARAASAGTYIHYASHAAYMAPGTTLGAATPVQMGGGSTPLPDADPAGDGAGDGANDGDQASDPAAESAGGTDDAGDPAPTDAKTAKAVNDAAAYIRSLAEMRGRNAEWAERAVRQAATLTDRKAVEMNVADGRADSLAALLAALDGTRVELERGPVTLELAEARIERAPPDWRDRLLSILADPNLAFILMMLGVYGLIFEFSNPGLAIPGVLGAICLLLGLYALNVLPVNFAGLGLIGVGIAFMVAEAFVPSFGALGLGGLAAFALGSTLLFETGSGAYELSWWTIAGTTALTGLVLLVVVGIMIRSQRGPVTTGEDTLIGQTAEVDSWQGGHGRVLLHGEYWNATGPRGLAAGAPVRVTARKGLTLDVVPADAPVGPEHDPDRPQTSGA